MKIDTYDILNNNIILFTFKLGSEMKRRNKYLISIAINNYVFQHLHAQKYR